MVNKFQAWLQTYYSIKVLRSIIFAIYFLSEIILFLYLLVLPIQISYYWLIPHTRYVEKNLDIVALVIFVVHLFLYFDQNLKIVLKYSNNKPATYLGILLPSKWLKLISIEFLYDLVCIGLGIAMLLQDKHDTENEIRAVQLIYLLKIYKLAVFHSKCVSLVIGSSFYLIYNLLYGVFIFLIIASYVGCAFYSIDYAIYKQEPPSPYEDLLWIVNTGSWQNIVGQDLLTQIMYTMFWSIGTASTAAYGDVSGAEPTDSLFNILCLLFEGFLFGFYISRMYEIPKEINKHQNAVLEIFQEFEEHNKIIINNHSVLTPISKELYFKILCSLEYQQNRQNNQYEASSLLPIEYLTEIKMAMYQSFLDANPYNLFKSSETKQALVQHIQQLVTENGQDIYQYNHIHQNQLFFIQEGSVSLQFTIDHTLFYNHYQTANFFGFFNFFTNLQICHQQAICKDYCKIYYISRENYKKSLSIQQKIEFQLKFEQSIAFYAEILNFQPITAYNETLVKKKSNVLFLNPEKKCEQIYFVNKACYALQNMKRTQFKRLSLRSKKLSKLSFSKKKTVFTQTVEEKKAELIFEKLLII